MAATCCASRPQPNCYGEGCVDPEGSVSIVEVHPWRRRLPVKTIRFGGVDLPAGVRLSGPGGTAAQDLEPEYVSIAEDDRTAYVTLQENNAVAVIDLKRAEVREVYPLAASPSTSPALSMGRLMAWVALPPALRVRPARGIEDASVLLTLLL